MQRSIVQHSIVLCSGPLFSVSTCLAAASTVSSTGREAVQRRDEGSPPLGGTCSLLSSPASAPCRREGGLQLYNTATLLYLYLYLYSVNIPAPILYCTCRREVRPDWENTLAALGYRVRREHRFSQL